MEPTDTEGVTGKAAYEARKQEKLRMKGSTVPGQSLENGTARRWVVRIGITAICLALLYGLYVLVKRGGPQTADMSQAIPIMANVEHIAVGAPHEAYNSNPPTSGPHYAEPAKPGFRTEPIVDEHLLHSMEHGLVLISYHPRVPANVKEALKVFDNGWVVIIEREANTTDIALAAWGRLDTFNLTDSEMLTPDMPRIKDFVTRYRNKGPEKIPAGQHGGV